MNKKTLYILVTFIIILVLSIPGAFILGQKMERDEQEEEKEEKQEEQDDSKDEEEKEDDLDVKEEDYTSEKVKVDSIKPNDVITEETLITGEALKTWFFEADFPVYLKDQSGDKLGSGYAMVDASKMGGVDFYEYEEDYVPFKVEWIEFEPGNNEVGTILFEKDNPSGEEENYDSYSFPVRFDSEVKTISVKVYFYNTVKDPEMLDCSKTFEVKRVIPYTAAVGKASIDELLKGPTTEEEKLGYGTNIPDGVKVNSLSIENGTAYIDFNNTLQDKVGGSCRVTSIRAQIEETLEQFSSVDKVVISIEGETEDILQP